MDSERFLASIIESCQDCILGMKPDGTILTWNKGAEKIFGYRSSEMMGKNIRVLSNDFEDENFDAILQMALKGAFIEHYETTLNRDGTDIVVSVSVSPVRSRGEIVGISYIARDITDSKAARIMQQQIELHEQREDFVAALTHDLKNPIIGCHRILDLMVQGKVEIEKQPDLFRKMLVSHTEVLQIINDLLSVFRYERQTSYAGRELVDFTELVRSAVEMVEPAAMAKNVHFNLTIKSGLYTTGEPGPLRRVITNLLDNALKFSPEFATIKVELSDSAHKLILKITDQGAGIPEEEQINLFHKFWQGRVGKSYSLGSGLGLYLCRQIIEAHDGRILCSSRLNSGTTFTIELSKDAPEGEVSIVRAV
ncbi:MAG: PAS domain-containing sensor histidine kinase [Candidatus Melainabacteria bacterium]|nr:PAS domain-containing sensor histidine kinase [Candidatus Melainabacteria bacterium]